MTSKLWSAALGGAGVAAAYQVKDQKDVAHVFSSLSANASGGASGSSPASPQMDSLSKDVEDLKRLLVQQSRGQQPVTIVHRDQKGGGWSVYMVLAGGVLVYLGYLRFYKGIRLGDLLYVTRASLNQSVTEVRQGIEGLQSRLQNTRKFIQQQLDYVTSRQDEGIKKQDELQEKLTEVGQDVEATLQDVGGVRSQVEDLSASVSYTNKGVFLLLGVVAELMNVGGYQGKAFEKLQTFANNKPPQLIESLGLAIEEDPGMGEDAAPYMTRRTLTGVRGSSPTESDEPVGLGSLKESNGRGSGGVMFLKTASTPLNL